MFLSLMVGVVLVILIFFVVRKGCVIDVVWFNCSYEIILEV